MKTIPRTVLLQSITSLIFLWICSISSSIRTSQSKCMQILSLPTIRIIITYTTCSTIYPRGSKSSLSSVASCSKRTTCITTAFCTIILLNTIPSIRSSATTRISNIWLSGIKFSTLYTPQTASLLSRKISYTILIT